MKKIVLSCAFLFVNVSTVAQVTTASYCLVNKDNDVSIGCTGTKLESTSINQFIEAYTDTNQSISLVGPSGSTFTPLVAQSTSLTANQLLPASLMSQLKLETPPNVLNWSVMPKVVIFGGSQSEGQVVIPSRGWIRTAHRNQSLVLACLFLPPDVYGGDKLESQIDWLLTPKSDVAQQLVSLVKTYGFDGYFINAESSAASSRSRDFGQLMTKMKGLAKAQHVPIHIEWYVVGGVDIADDMITSEGVRVSDSAFVDHFIWADFRSQWSSLSPYLQSIYNPFRVEYGAYDETELKSLIAAKKTLKSSISYFTYNAIVTSSMNSLIESPETQDARTIQFWKQYGSAFQSDNERKRYVFPFVTNFNTGRGKEFYINGTAMDFGPWNSMELQSELPLIDWQQAQVSFDYDHVFEGGNSLRVNLESSFGERFRHRMCFFNCKPRLTTKTISLFDQIQLDIPNLSNDQRVVFSVYYQLDNQAVRPDVGGDIIATLCLNQDQNCCLELTTNASKNESGWSFSQMELNQKHSACMLEKVNRIDLAAVSSDNVSRLNLGRLIIANSSEQQKTKDVKVESIIFEYHRNPNTKKGQWLRWIQIPDAIGYDIYSGQQFIGETPYTSFWVDEIDTTVVTVVPFFADHHHIR